MKQSIQSSLLFLLILFGCSPSAPLSIAELKERVPQDLIDAGKISNGVFYCVTSDKKEYQQSEPVVITCLILNLTDKKKKIVEPLLTSFSIDYNNGGYAYYWMPDSGEMGSGIVLKPAEQWTKSVEIELRSITGTYEINFGWGDVKYPGHSGKICVNVVPAVDETLHQKKVKRLLDKLDRTYYDESLYSQSVGLYDKICCISRAEEDLLEMGNLAVGILRPVFALSQNPVIRGKIVQMLGQMNSRESLPELHQALKDPCSVVRKVTVDMLGSINDPSSREKLIYMLKDEDPRVRSEAVYALKNYSSDDIKQLIIDRMLTDKDMWVRETAATILAKQYKFTGAIPVLIESLKNNDSDVSASPISALQSVTGLNFGPAPTPWLHSSTDQIEKAQKELKQTINNWLLWWQREGEKKYSGQ